MATPTAERSFAEELAALNEWHFFREFVYSQTTFQPAPRQEVELADNIVALGELLIAYQLKEREPMPGADAETEKRWFESKVLGKATRQIRDTDRYLREHETIQLQNGRGHRAQLAFSSIRQFHKLVVYLPQPPLPEDCRAIKHHLSTSVGVIHVLSGNDYLGIVRTLLTPTEVGDYLAFREALIGRWPDDIQAVSEPSLVGQYLSGDQESRPSTKFLDFLERLEHRAEEWDMSGLVSKFPNRVTSDNEPTDYYAIVREIAMLKREELRHFKLRYQLCMENTRADKAEWPYRMAVPRTGCGFVFIPETKDSLATRQVKLTNLTVAHKFDLRLSKCMGVSIADDGARWFTILWCYLESPWQEDPEFAQFLKEHFPFRKVTHVATPRYSFDREKDDPA